MRKVLAPTDFSEDAMNAIRYALELFKYERSEFIIMHAYADEVYENTSKMSRTQFEAYKKKIKTQSNSALEKVLKKILEISPNPRHKYNVLSQFGSLVDEANDVVDKENIDVVVMGTKGKTNDRNITYGSNTLQVIKYVKCPVLAIPYVYKDYAPQNILFATDYLLPFQRREIKLLSSIAKNFVANIKFLYVSKSNKLSFKQEDNRSFLECYLIDAITSYHTKKGKDIIKVINEAIDELNIDMLVLINTRHSYLENILHTSTIQKIGLHIKIPFLVLQNLPRY